MYKRWPRYGLTCRYIIYVYVVPATSLAIGLLGSQSVQKINTQQANYCVALYLQNWLELHRIITTGTRATSFQKVKGSRSVPMSKSQGKSGQIGCMRLMPSSSCLSSNNLLHISTFSRTNSTWLFPKDHLIAVLIAFTHESQSLSHVLQGLESSTPLPLSLNFLWISIFPDSTIACQKKNQNDKSQ